MERKPKYCWAIGNNKPITGQPALKLSHPKRIKPQTMDQTKCHLVSKDELTEGYIQSQDPCQANRDKSPFELPRKNSRRCEIVCGSLLKLSDESIVTLALMKATCLAQSHLMPNDQLEQYKQPQKSPFMMKMRKEEPNGT